MATQEATVFNCQPTKKLPLILIDYLIATQDDSSLLERNVEISVKKILWGDVGVYVVSESGTP